MTPTVCASRCSVTSRSWRLKFALALEILDRRLESPRSRRGPSRRAAASSASTCFPVPPKRTVALARTRGSPSRRPGVVPVSKRPGRQEHSHCTVLPDHCGSRRGHRRPGHLCAVGGHRVAAAMSSCPRPFTRTHVLTTTVSAYRHALSLRRGALPQVSAGDLRRVVGQEHVTEPLCTALAAGRINHAYLFSGPRGCGRPRRRASWPGR